MGGPIDKSLLLLEKQEREHFDIPLRNHILSFKLGNRFLQLFLNLSSDEDFKLRVEYVAFEIWWELYSLFKKPIAGLRWLIVDLDHEYTKLLEKMKNVVIRPGIEEHSHLFQDFNLWRQNLKPVNNFLLEILGFLSSCNVGFFSPWMKDTEYIKDNLMLLQSLLKYIEDTDVHIIENGLWFWAPLVSFLNEATYHIYLCLVSKMDEERRSEMQGMLIRLCFNFNVTEIYMGILRSTVLTKSIENPLKSEFYILDNLVKLLHINALNVPCEKLRDKLNPLETFISGLPREMHLEKFHYIVGSIEIITSQAIDIFTKCHDMDLKEDMASEEYASLSVMIDQILDIRTHAKASYPKTDDLGFMDLLLKNLEELLNCRLESIEVLKSQVETLFVDFDFLRIFLRKIKEKYHECEEREDLWIHIMDLAYRVEYIIDFYLVDKMLDSRIMLSLENIIEDTKDIRSKVKTIYDEDKYHNQTLNVAKTSTHISSKAIGIASDDEVVGFEDEVDKIMEYLLKGAKTRDVVLIVGLPGLGKTTLARKMFEDPLLIHHFDVRAWCTVSQSYQKRELLLTILRDIIEITKEISNLTDEGLAEKLYKSLKGRRYFIVIDDLWDIEAWNDVVGIFSDDGIGSRIIVTSRIQSVAPQTKIGAWKVHLLREFSEVEGWKLFEKKLCQKKRLPQEFQKVGKQIVESCKGLPLSIVVIASLLSRMETLDMWEHVAANLSSHILHDPRSLCKEIIDMSYKHLPNHLRSCFLYFGAFAEDEEISSSKLKWLWIAEGFVRNTEAKSLDVVAEEYLMDLINRSLVIPTRERSLGGVKACQVHDLLHEFCLGKAKEESFLQVIHWTDKIPFLRTYDQRRLSIIYKEWKNRFNHDLIFGGSVRTLLLSTNSPGLFSNKGYPLTLFKYFKLLIVLDLEYTETYNYNGVELLIHLRYLALKCHERSIPPSISNLRNLQVFLVKEDLFDTFHVPDSLWDMVNLRHVRIGYMTNFDLHANRLDMSCSLLDNLETLSAPSLCYEDAHNLLTRLPKLSKLKCHYYKRDNDSDDCFRFPVLDYLNQLISLKITLTNLVRESYYEISQNCFPSNLKKLSLSMFPLKWDEISKIGRILPKLEVLKLDLDVADLYKTWYVDDGDFPNLKYLKLSRCDRLCNWSASDDCFPRLEKLVLDCCTSLDEIPLCFNDIFTLRVITVKNCQPSVDDSARRIQKALEEEREYYGLKLYIYPIPVKRDNTV